MVLSLLHQNICPRSNLLKDTEIKIDPYEDMLNITYIVFFFKQKRFINYIDRY